MINDKNYKESFKGIQVVEFSGESCANCLTLMPLLYQLCKERSIPLLHVEAGDDTLKVLSEYQIDRVPTVILMDNGIEFARATGFQPQEIFEIWLDAKIEEYTKKN